MARSNLSQNDRKKGQNNDYSVIQLKHVDKRPADNTYIFDQLPILSSEGIEQIIIKKHTSKLRSNSPVFRFSEETKP